MIIVLNALIVKTKLVQTKTQSKVLVIACLRIEQTITNFTSNYANIRNSKQ